MLYEGDEWFLADTAVAFVESVNARFPDRDQLSDGSIGDASHQSAVSDHNPCWTCKGGHEGVVRAIDLDANLDAKDSGAMWRMAKQLARFGASGKDQGVLSYIIYDRQIASRPYGFAWRPYDGTNPHTAHMHVSFMPRGDLNVILLPLRILRTSDATVSRLRHVSHDLQMKASPDYRMEYRQTMSARRDARRLDNVLSEHV